uniref:Transcription factor TFIIB cyclin-like domain-containing protein n=1 Tax=Brassica oleracea TaxID=3712 RepID=A0A3P6C5X7_BRAOL|nr:unnamed protein product [Brassica oleracea]
MKRCNIKRNTFKCLVLREFLNLIRSASSYNLYVCATLTTEKNNASSSDDDNLKNLGFDHLAVATTQQSNASSDDATIIASMSDRLNLLATVKNQDTDISEQIKGQINIPNIRFAASIYIACRQNGMTLSIKEISYVADGAEESKITNAVRSVVKKLGLPPQLMHIRAAEFAKRYSTNLQMDSQAVKAAEEAVERCTDHVNRVFKMWGFDDCCSRYQTSDGFVYNHVAKNPSSSSDDNLQKLGFDLDVSTTQQSNASSDDATVIASMSDRLSLRATVKNQATEISEQIKGQINILNVLLLLST